MNNYKSKNTKNSKHKTKVYLFLILGMAFSQSFAQYEIRKHSINSGGGNMSGGSFEINASIAQVDASNAQSGDNYKLTSGFWHENNDLIYKNGVE